MSQVIIENPILNTPFSEPTRHFKFTEEGITNEIIESRRKSAYFIPIARPKKKDKSPFLLQSEWTQDRLQLNHEVNQIRARVSIWRQGGYAGVTKTTGRLLEYWTDPEREKRFFFCQIEAIETAIYLAEVASKFGDSWITNLIREANDAANPGLFRIAFKMATGAGKTVVMAMLIAWQALNKLANRQDARFTDAFLIVTPGITIRDRLRVLLPNDPQNYYRERDVLPEEWLQELGRAKILITNFHAFMRREKVAAGKLTKSLLSKGKGDAFTETPDEMVRRVCRELGSQRQIIVINDEAHHCYRRRADAEPVKLKGDDRKEAEKRDKQARIWISGLEAVARKIGIKTVYDLSATPFFLRGSGYKEGALFPWAVSDFSLIDAIESGIVKIPRVPVADDSMTGDMPTYREIWLRIREQLPKKGRGTEDASGGEPKLPKELQGALHSLYGNYEKYYRRWEQNETARQRGQTPPVFIVVCNNTNVSKLVYDYIAGWSKTLPDGSQIVIPGALPIFNNEENGHWRSRPNTILIDSEQLDSGEAMSKEFKKIAAAEIEQFKAEYRERFPGRDAEQLTDEDLLREVMNTVGKAGRLGEHVKCVVSVSMLTEGWDANTVTHILGVRAFGTQLLCEQVVGRGLRRRSYAVNDDHKFEPEYAEVYGVPFSFIPCAGSTDEPPEPREVTHVRALDERLDCEITFPKLLGYRYDMPDEKLSATFTRASRLSLSTKQIPSKTENAPIVGETTIHELDDLKKRRPQEVAFLLAKLVLEKYFRGDRQEPAASEEPAKEHKWESEVQAWRFPEVLAITKRWLDECVTLKDNTFPQMLLLLELAHDAADKIYRSIAEAHHGQRVLKPILQPYNTVGSTRYVDFDTARPVYETRPDKCHVSHVVGDTKSWEQKMAQTLEDMGEVVHYVKNQNLGFTIPYTLNGQEHRYVPDFIAHIDDGRDGLLNLIIEVTGQKRKDKAAKVDTACALWVPAVNNHGGFGRWDFLEIADPWDAQNLIRAHLSGTIPLAART